MARVPGCEAVYEVADQWRERCLEQDGSLLWPDLEEPTWTPENLERTRDLMNQLILSRKTTDVDMKAIFASESEAVKRTIADATTLWNLVPGSLKPSSRLGFSKTIASWVAAPPSFEHVKTALDQNIGASEASYFLPGYQLQRGAHLRFIVEFSRRIKIEGTDTKDLSALRALASRVLKDYARGHSARNMVLHLLFPDDYESVFNNWAKDKIANAPAFAQYADGITDWDDRLDAIRKGLTNSRKGDAFDFYDQEVRELWRPVGNPSEVVHFVDNTPGFLEWVDANPNGYILNTRRNVMANDLMLHRVGCSHISFDEEVNLTGPYTKACSLCIDRRHG